MHTHSNNKQNENFERMLSACQKADGNCSMRQETSVHVGIHAKRETITSKVYCETLKKKNCLRHSKQTV
jgi:hypothetical protein